MWVRLKTNNLTFVIFQFLVAGIIVVIVLRNFPLFGFFWALFGVRVCVCVWFCFGFGGCLAFNFYIWKYES